MIILSCQNLTNQHKQYSNSILHKVNVDNVKGCTKSGLKNSYLLINNLSISSKVICGSNLPSGEIKNLAGISDTP